jgi:hypothetical protein
MIAEHGRFSLALPETMISFTEFSVLNLWTPGNIKKEKVT